MAGFAAIAVLGGCAVRPPAPSVAALPGPGKGVAQFQRDERDCRASAAVAVSPVFVGEAAQRQFDAAYSQCMLRSGEALEVPPPVLRPAGPGSGPPPLTFVGPSIVFVLPPHQAGPTSLAKLPAP